MYSFLKLPPVIKTCTGMLLVKNIINIQASLQHLNTSSLHPNQPSVFKSALSSFRQALNINTFVSGQFLQSTKMQVQAIISFLFLAVSFVSASPLVSRTDDFSHLDDHTRAILRKVNAKCYKQCVDQCNTFYKHPGDEAIVQMCFNRHCVKFLKDGRCLRK